MVPRPEQVRGLMQDPAFTTRIARRVRSWIGFNEIDGADVLDLVTEGRIPADYFTDGYVIHFCVENGQILESLAARITHAATGDGAARLYLGPWKAFANIDPEGERLQPGVHLWLGSTIHLIAPPRAA